MEQESTDKFKQLVRYSDYEGHRVAHVNIHIKFPWEYVKDEEDMANELCKKIMRLDVVDKAINDAKKGSDYQKLKKQVLHTKSVENLIDLHVELNKESV